MGSLKSEVKLGLLHEMGCRYEDIKEEYTRARYRAEGARDASKKMGIAVSQLAKLVDEDVDKGRYEIEVATKIKEYISRASTMLLSFAQHAEKEQQASVGRLEAMDHVLVITKKEHDLEELKREKFLLEEAQAEKELSEPEPPAPPVVPAQAPEPKKPDPPKPAPEKRRVKRKAKQKEQPAPQGSNGSVPKRKRLREKLANASNS